MYNEGASDFLIDQGLYYPTASYGYVCTGFEPAGDWEDHHMIFGLDGQDMQYTGVANETLPYLYYTPNYGYGQSPYNPYNPYIPGAILGGDGSIVATQQYYAVPSYENPASSSPYAPLILQPRHDNNANGISNSYIDTPTSVNKVDGLVSKHNLPSTTRNSSLNGVGDTSIRRNSFAKASEGARDNAGPGKQPMPSISSGSFMSQASLKTSQVRVPQGTENGLHGKASLASGPLKSAFTTANSNAQAYVHKVKPKIPYGRINDDERVSPDTSSEQNQGPKTNTSKNKLVVKAYTTRAGNPDAQGNIIISMDQYNKADFPVNYVNAKFFVIKSYSEDDVHKSIKYNVWSSTPNGNKKLHAAYEDAQRVAHGDSRGCPIFLFFSVNASGQFCGVAEMTGPVDFHRDMDFWQQDKWSGSFPVKWHIIKDLPNPNFRHIILENNENKPVTNSRDTQEIFYKKGLEMLQIFKTYALKTSLLDDFMYYEDRQRILQQERVRLFLKSYENPYLAPLQDPPRKLQLLHDFPSIGDVNGTKHDTNSMTIVNTNEVPPDGKSDKKNSAPANQVPIDSNTVYGSRQVLADGLPKVNELKISSLTINSGETESGRPLPTPAAASSAGSKGMVNVVTIGSMPVKVMDDESSGFMTVGTIPLDPRALQRD